MPSQIILVTESETNEVLLIRVADIKDIQACPSINGNSETIITYGDYSVRVRDDYNAVQDKIQLRND